MNEMGHILKLRCLGLHKKDKLKNTTLMAVSSNEFRDSLWKPTVRNFRERKGVVNLFSENLGRDRMPLPVAWAKKAGQW